MLLGMVRRIATSVPAMRRFRAGEILFRRPVLGGTRMLRTRDLCGSENRDQFLHALDHDGWWRVFESLRARQISTVSVSRSSPPPSVSVQVTVNRRVLRWVAPGTSRRGDARGHGPTPGSPEACAHGSGGAAYGGPLPRSGGSARASR